MPSPKKMKWLQVAVRASEYRVLSASSELAPVSQRAQESSRRLQDSQEASMQGHVEWRDHLSGASFNADRDRQFRQFQAHLASTEALRSEENISAQQSLAQALGLLRQELAEKNGLKAALERANQKTVDEGTRRVQREADEAWGARHQKEASL
jgi:hypothetical protein